jgi:hypothetical protein
VGIGLGIVSSIGSVVHSGVGLGAGAGVGYGIVGCC